MEMQVKAPFPPGSPAFSLEATSTYDSAVHMPGKENRPTENGCCSEDANEIGDQQGLSNAAPTCSSQSHSTDSASPCNGGNAQFPYACTSPTKCKHFNQSLPEPSALLKSAAEPCVKRTKLMQMNETVPAKASKMERPFGRIDLAVKGLRESFTSALQTSLLELDHLESILSDEASDHVCSGTDRAAVHGGAVDPARARASLSLIQSASEAVEGLLAAHQTEYKAALALLSDIGRTFRSAVDSSHAGLLLQENTRLAHELASLRQLATTSKADLADMLCKEEEAHLSDLAVLASRNRELLAELEASKSKAESFSAALKTVQEHYNTLSSEYDRFLTMIGGMLKMPTSCTPSSTVEIEEAALGRLSQLDREHQELTSILGEVSAKLSERMPEMPSPLASEQLLQRIDCLINGSKALASLKSIGFGELQAAVQEIAASFRDVSCNQLNGLSALASSLSDYQKALMLDITRYVTCLRLQVQQTPELNLLRTIEAKCDSLSSFADESSKCLQKMAETEKIATGLRAANLMLARDLAAAREALSSATSEKTQMHRKAEALSIQVSHLQNENAEMGRKIESLDLRAAQMSGRAESLGIQVIHLQSENEALRSRNEATIKDQELLRIAKLEALRQSHELEMGKVTREHEAELKTLIAQIEELQKAQSSESRLDDNPFAASREGISAVANRAASGVVVTFTGFRAGHPAYNPGYQQELAAVVESLGGRVHGGAEFSEEITHVLAPSGYRSVRVLAASLTSKWIVDGKWLEACRAAGCFVCEAEHSGFRNVTARPFKNVAIWMSSGFETAFQAHGHYPAAALKTLLEKLGRARWTRERNEANWLLVSEDELNRYATAALQPGQRLVTLNELLDLIPTG